MMKFFLLILSIYITKASSSFEKEIEWRNFKTTFGRQFRDVQHEQERQEIFNAELDFLAEHNAKFEKGLSTFTVGINNFSDWTLQEFRDFNRAQSPVSRGEIRINNSEDRLKTPSTVDWRDRGVVSRVQNQGSCGSCWAFAVAGAIEGAWAIATGDLYNLSEQELVDCGQGDCGGGWTSKAYDTVIAMGGIMQESDYSYNGGESSCKYQDDLAVAHISSYQSCLSMNEEDMAYSVYLMGPVTALVDASPHSFKSYRSGVYYDPDCSTSSVNHAMLVVGFDQSDSSQERNYWTVKNSWGSSWGMSGYIHMRMWQNTCNIARYPDYPRV